MDFDAILESGYYIRAYIMQRSIATEFSGHVRFPGELTREIKWTPLSKDRDRKYIDFFPYIKPEDNRFRIWDIEAACDLAVSAYKGSVVEEGNRSSEGDEATMTAKTKRQSGRIALTSFHADDVKRRWPSVYELIRKMGYWQDTDS